MRQLVWFKRDLRIDDHAPLYEAARQGAVLPVYIIEPDYWQQPDTSLRQWHFIKASLQRLDQELTKLGQPLIIEVGPASHVLLALCQKFQICQVHSHEETGNLWTYQRDLAVARALKRQSIPWRQYRQFAVLRGSVNRDHWQRETDTWLKEPLVPRPVRLPLLHEPDPKPLPELTRNRDIGACIQRFDTLLTTTYDSFFCNRHQHYLRSIGKPAASAEHSSRLSPFLAYGELSLRQLFQDTQLKLQHSGANRANLSAFLSRLRWHCHFIQKFETEPAIEFLPMHSGFIGFREDSFEPHRYSSWCTGHTGYPLIDACMRALLATGWLHFRGRAMLASFASYYLGLPWRPIALHLAKCFIDYEPGIHYPQIQMQCGVTGINVNRMYNPVKQSKERDPSGSYIRYWVPELATVPTSWIHTPWLMPGSVRQRFASLVSSNYPAPIVEPDAAIKSARHALLQWKEKLDPIDWQMRKQQVIEKHASRRRPHRHVTTKVNTRQIGLPGFEDL